MGLEGVRADAEPVVALPATSLSLDPDSTIQVAARLAAAWLLFQAVLGLKGIRQPRPGLPGSSSAMQPSWPSFRSSRR